MCILLGGLSAQEIPPSADILESSRIREQVVKYPYSFFLRFKPATALDVVRQVPGFQIDDGNDSRGFGEAAGNILINGRRPSAKEDLPSSILGRIPAELVEGIDLIRGHVSGVDMRGQTVVVNVQLRQDAPSTIRWETGVRKNTLRDRLLLRGNVSISNHWRGIEYNAGLSGERNASGEDGAENIFDGTDLLIEKRIEDSTEDANKGALNLTASGWWGNTLLQLNTRVNNTKEDEPLTSTRLPQISGREFRRDEFLRNQKDFEYEQGITAEQDFMEDFTGKLIGLYSYEDNDVFSSESRFDLNNVLVLFRSADRVSVSREGIIRAELDWDGVDAHSIQIYLEGAYNSLDSSLIQLQDDGSGLVNIDVPGANTRVEELRGDFLLRDTWNLDKVEIDYGLGAEVSNISQSGDANQERNFFYLKPHAVVSYSPSQAIQSRIRLAREVAQLDFDDFVSASIFLDDDVTLGNPDLRPDTTWILETSHERRFSQESVVKVTLFHHWINDVLDLLPVTSTSEAPGNIGDGRRWGIKVESTLPLDWTGLRGAKLDLKYRWQDSKVIDPVTGDHRVLSGERGFGGTPHIAFDNENRYALILDYRQDFEDARVAWGLNVGMRAKREVFKVNELDIYEEGVAFNGFIETTRWLGVKFRLVGENLSNLRQVRDRTIFVGERDLFPVDVRENNLGKEGVRITLAMSGSF
jgi:hypothetical protein